MKSFKVSNFRLFGNEGAEVNFKPVTVLTGTNSSGKSSYVKALVAYSDLMRSVLADYRRNGYYNPAEHKLDVYRPELKLKGFSSTINRNGSQEAGVSFTREFDPSISSIGKYRIKQTFVPSLYPDSVMDYGYLSIIQLSIEDEEVLTLSRDDKRFKLESINLNGALLSDFLAFCRYCYIPSQIIDNSHDEIDGSFFPEYYDEEGHFSPEKTAQTDPGKLLAKIQGKDIPVFDYYSILHDIPIDKRRRYHWLFKNFSHAMDLAKAIEKCEEYNLLFYFPVFEQFENKNKEESISILENSFSSNYISSYLGGDAFQKRTQDKLKSLIDDYRDSEFESFIDYFRSLENYVLEHVNKTMRTIPRGDRSFNFIDDEIIQRIDVAFNSLGFSVWNTSETMFSVAYQLLSIWQWDETREYNRGSFEEGAVIYDNDEFIERSVDRQYFDYSSRHILYNAYLDYIRLVLNESLISDELSRLAYYNNSFSSVQRLHSFEENSQLVRVMKEYVLGRDKLSKEFKSYVPDTFLNKWLGKGGLNICDHIELNAKKIEGLGFMIELVQESGDTESLADLGHGITQMISILLQIENALIQGHINSITSRLTGESCPPAVIIFEEPEVSLHPSMQSRLAEIFYDASTNYGQALFFIVESHSEYLVRKMQAIVAGFNEQQFSQNPFAVYYFKPDGDIYDLGFTPTGRFEKTFGPGFFDESARSRYEVLKREELESNGNS